MSALAELVDRGLVRTGVVLGTLTTYKLGGAARFFAEPVTPEELSAVLTARRSDDVPLLVLGRGSNLVIADAGFEGVVIRLGSGFAAVTQRPDHVEAGGAVSLPMLARACVAEGRLGLEFYVGIPGSVGGAVRQNAGCHGSETSDFLLSADVVGPDGSIRARRVGELDLSYRHSNLSDEDIVVTARYSFTAGDPTDGERTMRDVIRWRKEYQPGGTLNAGSVFKNPPGDAAGRIIDGLGLKGMSVGGASVSTRHANFFVATSEATAGDVRDLVFAVQRIVVERSGVLLEPEIRFAGFEVDQP
ncbi:MAG: UDP-N-acetylmuramate dehydrogenase [Acidimicrobiia bacterium]